MARRAVIFDMDGVLVLSGPAHWQAWREVAAARGVVLSRERFASLHGLTNTDICAELWGERATPDFVAEVAAVKERDYRRIVADAVPLAPGCRELLEALQRCHVGIAVGSSAPPENVDLVLDAGGIRSFFGAVVSADMVRRGKPAPDIFLLAADLLGLTPGECVVVEDAPSGVQAALAAGMAVVGVASNVAPGHLRAAGAATIVACLADLAATDLVGP